MRKEDEKIIAFAQAAALKEELRLLKETNEENCKVAQVLHSRLHSAIAFIKLQRYHFCNNNKCCENGLNWLADEIEKILLGS